MNTVIAPNGRSVDELDELIIVACETNEPEQLSVLIEEYNHVATSPFDFEAGWSDRLAQVFQTGSPELFQLMMQHGLSKDRVDDYIPLHEAILWGNLPLAQFLIRLGVDAYPPPHHPRHKKAFLAIISQVLESGKASRMLLGLSSVIGCEPLRTSKVYQRVLGSGQLGAVRTLLELVPEFVDLETAAFNRTRFGFQPLTMFIWALIKSDDWETLEWGLERLGVVRDPLLPVPVPPDFADTYIRLKKARQFESTQQTDVVIASRTSGSGGSTGTHLEDSSKPGVVSQSPIRPAASLTTKDAALWTKADLLQFIDQLSHQHCDTTEKFSPLYTAIQESKINAAKYCRHVFGIDWTSQPIPARPSQSPHVQDRDHAQSETTTWSSDAIKKEVNRLFELSLCSSPFFDLSKCFPTPLHYLPQTPQHALDWMVSEGFVIEDYLDHPDYEGNTPLESALKQGYPNPTLLLRTLLSLYNRLDPNNLPRQLRLTLTTSGCTPGLKPLLEAYFNQFRRDIAQGLDSTDPPSATSPVPDSGDEIDAAARAQVFALIIKPWDQYTSEFAAHDHKLKAISEAQTGGQTNSLTVAVARHEHLQHLYENSLWYEGSNILWFCAEHGKAQDLAALLQYAAQPELVLQLTVPNHSIPGPQRENQRARMQPCPSISSNPIALEIGQCYQEFPQSPLFPRPYRPRRVLPGMTLLMVAGDKALVVLLDFLVNRIAPGLDSGSDEFPNESTSQYYWYEPEDESTSQYESEGDFDTDSDFW